MIYSAILVWQLIASMVTMHPFSVSNSNNASIAVISLDIAPVATCPSTARLALAQALTKSVDYLHHLRSDLEIEYEPLMRLP
jgi:hypothetical protein